MQNKQINKGQGQTKLFILETHHPEIITDDVLVHMITLLLIYFFLYLCLKQKLVHITHSLASCFLHFIKYQKRVSYQYPTKLFLMAT